MQMTAGTSSSANIIYLAGAIQSDAMGMLGPLVLYRARAL